MKKKFIESVYANSIWIILASLLLGFLSFNILRPEISIQETIKDFYAWIHTAFVVTSNVIMVSAAYDTATQKGTDSEEFERADLLNNKLIEKYNQEQDAFRQFVKNLNYQERKTIQDEFLFGVGKDNYEDLTEEEKKKFDSLKPMYHNISGFNLPLYYEADKGGEISYKASEKKNDGKTRHMITKGATGIIFSAMTVNVVVNFQNVGSAFLSLFIISGGLLVTFLIIFTPRVHKFRNELPKRVLHKKALWDSYANKPQEAKKVEVEQISTETQEIPPQA